MQKKQKLIDAALFLGCGLLYYIPFIFIFTKMFDKRLPVIQEFIPIIPLVLLSILLIFTDRK
jgi:hypothetical protein